MLLLLLACLQSSVEPEAPAACNLKEKVHHVSKTGHKSYDSSVKIMLFHENKESGHGSANYFAFSGQKFLLTAAHVVAGDLTPRVADGNKFVDLRIVYINYDNDVAILIPERDLEYTNPIKWKINHDDDIVGIDVVYSGFPSHYEKVLIRGMVSSEDDSGIIAQSFALPGSSGSVVFDSSGRVLGVVSAVGLHLSPLSPYPSLQEDMVFVSRIKLTNKMLREVFECAK